MDLHAPRAAKGPFPDLTHRTVAQVEAAGERWDATCAVCGAGALGTQATCRAFAANHHARTGHDVFVERVV